MEQFNSNSTQVILSSLLESFCEKLQDKNKLIKYLNSLYVLKVKVMNH